MNKWEILECSKCYHLFSDCDGVLTCLDCQRSFCLKHSIEHQNETFHRIFAISKVDTRQCAIINDGKIEYIDVPEEYTKIFNIFLVTLNNYQYREFDDVNFGVTKGTSMICGFLNIGNTCYFNSNLHVLFRIDEFVDYFCQDVFSHGENKEISFQLHRFLKELKSGNRSVMIPRLLRNAIDKGNERFLTSNPQDSILFFDYEISLLQNRYPDCPLTLCNFHYSNMCSCANKIDDSTQFKLRLLLDPNLDHTQKYKYTLDQLVQLNLMTEEQKCSNCDKLITKKIDVAPEYLFVNIVLDQNDYKIPVDLQFDMNNLDLTNYIIGENKSCYKLLAFMDHRGERAELGHDISYARYDDVWYCFNDDNATKTNLEHIRWGTQYLYLFKLLK